MTEPRAIPIDLQMLLRLAEARKREDGADPLATMEAMIADGKVRLTEQDRETVERLGVYLPLSRAMGGFLDAVKPAFIEYVRLTVPSEESEAVIAEIERAEGAVLLLLASEASALTRRFL